MAKYYVDSCIYLNLWKKEKNGGDLAGMAKKFFEQTTDDTIYFSGFVLREIKYKLPYQFYIVKISLFKEHHFKELIARKKDYRRSRMFERISNFSISFFDCMHLAIRTNSILITRDKKLITFANRYCLALRPEDLTNH